MPEMAEPLPMFPLGTVLLPTSVLPLQVFEPRYRALVADCLAADGEFGVTLIARGSEVGGGEVRTDIGTIAQIVQAREGSNGRWMLGTVGTRRFRVSEWLNDDPYPRARIEDWPEAPTVGDLDIARQGALDLLGEVAALSARLSGTQVAELPEIGADGALASYQLSALAPLGPLDQQSLLAASGPEERLSLLADLLAEQLTDLRLRLDLEDL
jgi:Lon protease-like protein